MAPLPAALGSAGDYYRRPSLISRPARFTPNTTTTARRTSLGPKARSSLDRRDARRMAACLAPLALLPARLGLTPLRETGVNDPPRLAEGGVIPPFSNGEKQKG